MIDLSSVDHVYLYPGHVDLRFGMERMRALVGACRCGKGERCVFVFCNKAERILKVFEKDCEGTWLYTRKLDGARFGWPKNSEEAREINKAQMTWLLMGLKAIGEARSKPLAEF